MGPIDYTSAFSDIPDPSQAFQAGVEGRVKLQALQTQQLQQQAAAQRQQVMQTQLAALAQNPTPQAIARFSIAFPELSKQLKESYDMLQPAQQQAELKRLAPVFSAVQAGKPDVAIGHLNTIADTLEGAGNVQDAKEARDMAKLIEANPRAASLIVGSGLAAVMGPDKFATTFKTIGEETRAAELQPATVEKAKADAATATVQAKYAEPTVLKDLELKGWNIENIKSEIGFRKEANRIAAMNAAASKESNELKRQELRLKIQEAEGKLAESARAKVADVESATSSIDNLINTVDRLKKNGSLDSVVGSIQGRMPAVFSDEANDAIALIDTLGSQAFMSQIPAMKGTGALSEKEGDKLQSSLQNLGRVQSEAQFRANLDEVQRLMLKARKNVETRYGVKAGVPDTPAVQSSPQQIDDLVNKYLNPKPPGAR